jgi:phage minor structural protein
MEGYLSMNLLFFDKYEKLIYTTDVVSSCVHTETADENSAMVIGWGFPSDAAYLAFKDNAGDLVLFEIKTSETDALTRQISLYAENAYYEMLTDYPIGDVRPTNATASAALSQALNGTRWTIGTNGGGSQTASVRWYYTSRISALSDISAKWGVLLKFRITVSGTNISGRYVDIVSSVPVWRGKRFEIGKDILAAKYTIDKRNIVTAIIGRGKGEEIGDGYGRRIEFSDVVWNTAAGDPVDKPAGQNYVENIEATTLYGVNGTRARFALKEYDDIEDPEELLSATWRDLLIASQPVVSATLTTFDLEKMGFPHEAVRYGDDVALVADEYRARATVISVRREYAQRGHDEIQLGAMRDSIINQLTGVRRDLTGASLKAAAGAAVAQANPSLLQGMIDTMVTRITSSGTRMYTDEFDGSLVFVNSNETSAVKITGEGFLIASSQTAGVWNWSTAADGTGIVADSITTGTLSAARIASGAIDSSKLANDAKMIQSSTAPSAPVAGWIWIDISQNPPQQKRFDGANWVDLTADLSGVLTQIDDMGVQVAGVTSQVDDLGSRVGTVEFQVTQDQFNVKLQNSTTYSSDKSALQSDINEKNKTFRESYEPTSGMSSGDLWFDTDDNNREYRYDNGTWQEVTDLRTADLVSRVTTAEQKITADAIISTVTSSSTFKQSQVYGRNYALQSDIDWTFVNGLCGSTDTMQLNATSGLSTISLTNLKVSYDFIWSGYSQDIVDNRTIIAYLRLVWTGNADPNNQTNVNYISTLNVYAPSTGATSYFRTSYNFTLSSYRVISINNVRLVGVTTSPGTIGIKRIKLETGAQATPWCPAVEDLADYDVRLTIAEQKITADAIVNTVRGSTSYTNDLAAKATTSALTALTTRVTTAESKITADAIVNTVRSSTSYTSDLSAKATTASVTALTTRVTTAESTITQQANQISLKVSSNGIISAINQTSESVTINAAKINLNGAVTANTYFKINANGSMAATSGTIGGWTISANGITANGTTLSSQYGQFTIKNNLILNADSTHGYVTADGSLVLTGGNYQLSIDNSGVNFPPYLNVLNLNAMPVIDPGSSTYKLLGVTNAGVIGKMAY